MVKGIGTDIAAIPRFQRLLDKPETSFFAKTFSERERAIGHTASFFAGRFAAKEAVFKALGPLTKNKSFDWRIIETLRNEDGSPYIFLSEELSSIMKEAEVDTLHISISHEKDYAVAFAIAEKRQHDSH